MGQNQSRTLFKIIILLLVILGGIFAYRQGLFSLLTWENLQKNKDKLQNFKESNFLLMSLAFFTIYVLAVTFSLPGASILSLSGGFLFGNFIGTFYVVCAATLGATLLYIAARWFMSDFAKSKTGGFIKKIESGLKEDGFWYILTLRLIPAFPFVAINLGCALLKAPIKQYILATFFGIIPGSFVYVSIGNGLNSATSSTEPNFGEIISQPSVWGPLVGLVLLSLLPIILKKIKKSKTA